MSRITNRGALAVIFVVLTVADVLSTQAMLGTGKASEANPFIWLAMQAAPHSWWIPKLVIMGALAAVILNKPYGRKLAIGGVIFMGVVVISNLAQYAWLVL